MQLKRSELQKLMTESETMLKSNVITNSTDLVEGMIWVEDILIMLLKIYTLSQGCTVCNAMLRTTVLSCGNMQFSTPVKLKPLD